MPITFNIDIAGRRKREQERQALENLRQGLVGMPAEGPPTQFGAIPSIGGILPPTPEAQFAERLLQSPLTAPSGVETALQVLEAERQAQLKQAELAQQMGAQERARTATEAAFAGLPLTDRPGMEALRRAALLPGAAGEEATKQLVGLLGPTTLSPEQQLVTPFGKQIAIAPKKATDLEAERQKLWADATGLRKEFTGITKPFSEQNQAYGRVIASSQDPSPAGDLALIFNYMKVLDPGSTVREGEFATAQQAGSVPQRITALYNQVLQGTRLTSTQRSDFVNRSTKLFEQASKQHKITAEEFRRLAKSRGVLPEDVLFQRQTVQPLPPIPAGFIQK